MDKKLKRTYEMAQSYRILSMSKEVFVTEKEARMFLKSTLPKKQDGRFWYYKSNAISCNSEDVFVFLRYDGRIIGCGVVELSIKKHFEHCGFSYEGYYQFYPDTVRVFKSALTKEAVQKYIPTIDSLGNQGTKKIDEQVREYYDAFIKLLEENI